MEIKGAIYSNSDFDYNSKVCDFVFLNIPTTSSHYCLKDVSYYRLTNLILINEPNIKGSFFIEKSLIVLERYSIELNLIEHETGSKQLFFKGNYNQKDCDISIKISHVDEGKITPREIKLPFVIRSTQDFISIDNRVYECDMVFFEKTGGISFSLFNDYNLLTIRDAPLFF